MLDILIDTREQIPWNFPEEAATVSRGMIPAGDYALKGDQFKFAIERKSLDDFVGTISSGWERFQAELARMIAFPAMVVIVEGNFAEINWRKYNHPDVGPAFICKRIAQLTFQGVSVLFCDNAVLAAGMCWRLLKERKAVLENGNPNRTN
jgi:ERCC4-type nuclease